MTAAELLCAREYLALPKAWLAKHVGVDPKTWWRYEAGKTPVPQHVEHKVKTLQHNTAKMVSAIALKADKPGDQILTYPDGHNTGTEFPASWHRMVVARAAERTNATINWKQ